MILGRDQSATTWPFTVITIDLPRFTSRRYSLNLVFNCLIPTVIISFFFGIESRDNHAESWFELPVRGSGISSHVLPSSSRPVLFFLVPPHCLKKNGTP
jgi:hypothetical protein